MIKFFQIIVFTMLIPSFSTLAMAYTPQPGDTIEVQILNKKELNTRQIIAPDGTVSLPFIGRTKVDGKSLETLDAQLKTEFAKYVQSPVVIVQVDQLKKTESKGENYFVSLANSETGTVEVKTVKTLTEAMAWTAGKSFQAYRVLKTGHKIALSPTENILPGDFLVVDLEKSKQEPIYIVVKDQGKNTITLHKASTIKEAMGWISADRCILRKTSQSNRLTHQNAGGIPEYQINVSSCITDPDSSLEVEPGDTLILTIGKPDDWLTENWYKILTSAAVVVGLFNSLK